MSADTTAPAFRASLRGRLGTYTLDVFAPGPAPATPALVRIEPPELGCDPASEDFGGGLYPWAADYVVTEGAAALESVLDAHPEPGAVLFRLSGPSGRTGAGGTFTVWSRPLSADRETSAAPRVYGSDRLSVPTTDGLAGLDKATYDSLGERLLVTVASVRNQVGNLWLALPGRIADGPSAASAPFAVHLSWTLAPGTNPDAGGPARALAQVQPADDPLPQDRLRRLCEVGGLSIYQPTDTATPRWEAVPRSAVGRAEPVARVSTDGTTISAGGAVLPGRTVELPPYAARPDGARRLPALGRIAVVGEVRRPYGRRTLGAGESFDLPLGHFEPTPGLRFAADVTFEDATTSGGQVAAILHTPDSGGGASVLPTGLTASGDDLTYTTANDLPSAGRVTLRLFGATGAGGDRLYEAGEVRAESASGALVERLEAAVTARGPEARVTRPLYGYASNGAPPASWASRTTGAAYPSVEAAAAATRASQQAAPLPLLAVTLDGLWGPESRFTLSAERSPFGAALDLIPVGLSPDIRLGTTEATLVAVRVDSPVVTLGLREQTTAPA